MAEPISSNKKEKEIRVALTGVFKIQQLKFKGAIKAKSSKTKKLLALSLETTLKGGLSLYALMKALDRDFDTNSLPDFLNDLPKFKSIQLSYGTGEAAKEFSFSLDTRLEINDKIFDFTLTYHSASAKKKGAKTAAFGGRLKLGKHQFNVNFLKTTIGGEPTTFLLANYRNSGQTTLRLKEMARKFFSQELEDVTPDLSLTLSNVNAFLLYSKKDNKKRLLFGMGQDMGLDLSDLPMAGRMMKDGAAFKIEDVLLMVANAAFSAEEMQAIALRSSGEMPKEAIRKNFNFSVKMAIDGPPKHYVISPKTEEAAAPTKKAAQADEKDRMAVPGTASAGAKWIKIKKKIGPVDLQRIGLGYYQGRIILLLDTSVSMSGLSINLLGLGVGFKPKWPLETPAFYLDGLGLSYNKAPIEVSGIFARIPREDGFEFTGGARIKAADFAVSGIGSYAKVGNLTSLFIYALYEGDIGGPSFFYVTGIALGFGYNRRIQLPPIEEVRDFPLVAMALNPDKTKGLNDVVTDLIQKDCIPIAAGNYWLAIGIRFTTFEILESFVLLTVQFSTHVEFGLLGLSVLSYPKGASPLAYIELAVKASFGTNSDVISVEAQLTPNSYVLDKNCRITGEFASFSWVRGQHKGDFVISLGGYHPSFPKPAHYPDVDRLRLNWALSSQLHMKGELYFALTPTAIMAGGSWEVVYDIGFLRASLSIWADMIIYWSPFRYDISMGVRISIRASIKILFIRVSFSISMGAQLHIWGPPFAGSVYIDWSIFSFTIPFGNQGGRKTDPISWDEFNKTFLPRNEQAAQKIAAANNVSIDEIPFSSQPTTIIIQDGILEEHQNEKGEVEYTIVNPHKLKVRLHAAMPITELEDHVLAMLGEEGRRKYASYSQSELGIRPMAVPKLTAIFTFDFSLKGQSLLAEGDRTFTVDCYSNGVPEALWSPHQGSRDNKNPEAPKIIQNTLAGLAIQPVEVPIPAGTPMFDLNGKFVHEGHSISWVVSYLRTGPDNKSYRESIKAEIKKKSPELENDLLTIMHDFSALEEEEAPELNIDTGQWEEWVDDLQDEPVISGIGEIPQYA